jgi:hypothetical protein
MRRAASAPRAESRDSVSTRTLVVSMSFADFEKAIDQLLE